MDWKPILNTNFKPNKKQYQTLYICINKLLNEQLSNDIS